MHGVLVEAEQLGEVVGLVRHERGQRVLALQRRRGGALAPTGALLRGAAATEHHPSRADRRHLRREARLGACGSLVRPGACGSGALTLCAR